MKSCLHFNSIRRISQTAIEKLKVIPSTNLIWKTNESDPRKHNNTHEGLFYLLPSEKEIVKIFGYTSPYDLEVTRLYKTLGIMPIMIRKPALDGMNYIERLKPSMANVRILYYGDKGHGKTHTLTHLIHYLHLKQEHLIIHVREMKRFTRAPREFSASTSRPGRINTNSDAALFLQQFRTQNAQLLDKLKEDLVCTSTYKWSLREESPKGAPLVSVAEHGVNRVIHASDCLAVLFKELILAADEGKIKLASVLDNVKFLFNREAGIIKTEDRKLILVDEMTAARAIKKLIKGTHKNSFVLASCDDKLSNKQNQTPADALGLEGWQYFDPFLPIHVPKYSRKEFESFMNMYQDIGWLTRPESRTQEARDELRFVSGMNPKELEYLCQEI